MDLRLLKTAVAAFLLTASGSALAQSQGKMPQVGVVMTGTPKSHGHVIRELRQGLFALGYREGQNIVLEPRYAMNERTALPKLANELLGLKVRLIVVTGTTAARATRKASASIPIVIASAGNLVGSGIVKSLAKPGGNTTGNTAYSGQMGPKQLQLLKEAIPDLRRVAVLHSTASPGRRTVDEVKRMKAAGLDLGINVVGLAVREKKDFEGAFAAMTDARADAVIFVVSRITSVHRKWLVTLAAKQNLPTMCWRPSMARDGCFMSYGADRNAMYRHAATFVHRILMGAKPGDLPIEQPTKFGLAVNLKTAKALGITVPQSLLIRADEVIE